ncbi:MAG: hypothetical protein IJI57_14045 [Flexilinea sp.]|nr:hypothetical protein [Flexilinea sp.]
MKTFMYVYVEYCDSDSFGEMITKVFATRMAAQKHLRKRVLEFCQHNNENFKIETINVNEKSLKDVLQKIGLQINAEDFVDDDQVLLINEKNCNHWKVIECPVEDEIC